ncbi:TetR family transcriptional regulator [Zavarzinia sp.]|uniref:TetR family transcriptional regulator n=1 Tax=Zavarzinia sp. TaxID=2027920 RepID=UPI003BB4F67E
MARESTQRHKADNRTSETAEQLLLAAAALMTERNTIDVPVADVASRAGLNAALVNYYFRTKTGLHIALVRRDAAQSVAEMQRLLATDLPPAEKMRRHLTGIIRTFYRCPYLYRLMRALMRDADSKAARELSEFFSRPVVETQKAIIAEGVATGAFRPIDPMMFHLCAIGACDHLFAESSTLRYTFGVTEIDQDLCNRYAETAVDLLMNGFLAKTA